jgi:hypothetical protein
VIVENIDGLPSLPLLGDGDDPPAPPAPTVIGYAVAPQTESEQEVLNPPAPPPPDAIVVLQVPVPPPDPPPATTNVSTNLVPGCVVNVVDPVTDVTVHFPNDVGLITPIIPPLGDPISHYSCLKIL